MKHYLSYALTGIAVMLTVGTALFAEEKSAPDRFLAPPAKGYSYPSLPQRVVVNGDYLFEDFESVPDDEQKLPDGWKAIATPNLENDVWSAGTLGLNGKPMNGTSGYKYAYILGNRDSKKQLPHDSWLFSPGVVLKEGVNYYIDLYTYMPEVPDRPDIKEKLDIHICSAQDPESIVITLDQLEKISGEGGWEPEYLDFTPDEERVYYLAFHSTSPFMSNATVIDDVKIYSSEIPAFGGSKTLDMGSTDTKTPYLQASYMIMNVGLAPLEVSLGECSPEISVEGLPLTIEETYGFSNISVKLNIQEVGEYQGFFTLITNDPSLPEVKVKVSANIKEAVVTGYIFENFELGGPHNWDLSFGSGNVSKWGGHESTRAWYSHTLNQSNEQNEMLDGVGFTTNYVEMGENPEFSFWYHLTDLDANDDFTGNKVPASKIKISALVTEDNGATWQEALVLAPGTDNEHQPSYDWQKISIDLAGFAGKTCRGRLVFKQVEGIPFFQGIRVLVDDVSFGTPLTSDLKVSSLTANTTMEVGQPYTFSVLVENLGTEPFSDYAISLIDLTDNSILASVDGVELHPAENSTIEIQWTPAETGPVHIASKITSTADVNPANDISYPLHAIVLPQDNSAIEIGEGKTLSSMYYPVNFYAVESASQTIYYANEIGIDRGVINSMVFQTNIASDYLSEPFTVYLAETDRTVFDETELIDPVSFTKVFEGEVFFPGNVADFVVPFDTPYEYKGGNIVVMTQKLGKEFILGQDFKVRECLDLHRSACAFTYQEGTLIENGYARPTISECYPDIRFNMVKAPYGSASGTVISDGKPVQGAKVSVAGTQLFTITDADGHFGFDQVATGDVALTVTQHGYPELLSEPLKVKEGEETVYNLTLTPYPLHTLSGTVTSAAGGYPVDGARISLKGYVNALTWTDTDGKYTFENVVAKTGEPYTVFITNDFHQNTIAHIDVDDDVTKNFEIADKPLRVHDVNASVSDGIANVTWSKTIPEFAHDFGNPVDFIGWTHGDGGTTLSSVFHKKARISQVSWFTSGKFTHSDFHVYIFGLDESGAPDATKMLYHASNVAAVDDEWSIHTLTQLVEADGFAVAIGCEGFMGLGITEPTDEYPFEEGQCFMAGDGYQVQQSPLSIFGKYHNMIRAYGENLGDSDCDNTEFVQAFNRPDSKYKVYRLCKGQFDEEWTEIGTTESESFSDKNWNSLPAGDYCYAVAALYSDNKESEATKSNYIETSGIDEIFADQDHLINLVWDSESEALNVIGCENIVKVVVCTSAGTVVSEMNSCPAYLDFTSFGKGMYIVTLVTSKGETVTAKILK